MIIKIILSVLLIAIFYLYLLSLVERKIERNNLNNNINQYKNTIAGGLENDRVNERQRKEK